MGILNAKKIYKRVGFFFILDQCTSLFDFVWLEAATSAKQTRFSRYQAKYRYSFLKFNDALQERRGDQDPHKKLVNFRRRVCANDNFLRNQGYIKKYFRMLSSPNFSNLKT